jgi:hypothetical protein
VIQLKSTYSLSSVSMMPVAVSEDHPVMNGPLKCFNISVFSLRVFHIQLKALSVVFGIWN